MPLPALVDATWFAGFDASHQRPSRSAKSNCMSLGRCAALPVPVPAAAPTVTNELRRALLLGDEGLGNRFLQQIRW